MKVIDGGITSLDVSSEEGHRANAREQWLNLL